MWAAIMTREAYERPRQRMVETVEMLLLTIIIIFLKLMRETQLSANNRPLTSTIYLADLALTRSSLRASSPAKPADSTNLMPWQPS